MQKHWKKSVIKQSKLNRRQDIFRLRGNYHNILGFSLIYIELQRIFRKVGGSQIIARKIKITIEEFKFKEYSESKKYSIRYYT